MSQKKASRRRRRLTTTTSTTNLAKATPICLQLRWWHSIYLWYLVCLIFDYILESTNHKSIKFGILVCIIKTQFPIVWCQYDKHPKVHRTPHRCSYFLWAILNKEASIWLKFGNMVKEHCRFIFIAPWRFAPNPKVPKALFSILGGTCRCKQVT